MSDLELKLNELAEKIKIIRENRRVSEKIILHDGDFFVLTEDTEEDWLNDMYQSGEIDSEELIAKRQAAAAHARSFIKRKSNDSIELTDERGIKVSAPSENRIKELENKIIKQNETLNIQAQQIQFLNNKLVTLQNQLNSIHDFMRMFSERF